MTGEPSVLRFARRFRATRERVFDAWTDPDALLQWFHPGVETVEVDLEARAGATYRIGVRREPGDEVIYVSGTIRQVRRPEYLELSWRPSLDAVGDEVCETVVAVTFVDRGLECELRVVQEAFPSRAARDLATLAWERCMELLRTLLLPIAAG